MCISKLSIRPFHVDNEDSDQTAQMCRLIWVFTGHTWQWRHCVGFATLRPNWYSLVKLVSACMHYAPVITTAPVGPGDDRDIDFSLCKVCVYAKHCRDIFIVKVLLKALFKSRPVNVKLPRPVWAQNQKPCGSKAQRGRCWGQNLALKPCYVP